LSITAARSTSFTTQVCSQDQKASQRPRRAFWAARHELVKVLDELRVAAGAVVDHGMVVVAHRARQQHVDLAAQRGGDQAVQERVVGHRVRAK
jgi:hypothetical protein